MAAASRRPYRRNSGRAMDAPAPDPAIFSHIRVVMGMIISLSLARLLSGVALFI